MRYWLGGQRFGRAVALLLLGSAMQAWAAGLTAAEIVDRMAAHNSQRQAALAEWSSERTYRLEYQGVGGSREATMTVRAEYRAPGEKRLTVVSEGGSKALCERVLRRLVASEEEAQGQPERTRSAVTNANYTAVLEGEEVVDGVRAWRLALEPKMASRFAVRGRAWVSEDDYGLVRMEGEPAKGVSWLVSRASVDARFARSGEFWLPERNVSVSQVRAGGEARLTIDYGTYAIRAVGQGGVATARLEPVR